ncbi:MAG: SPOR domain-containing protein [Marinirhabdus sp.]|nr:SPOR domain-containing protein [Marinirhabdus sp.]
MKNRNPFKALIVVILICCATEISLAQQATVTVNQDDRIPELLSLKKSLEKENKLTSGFTIQLYYGDLNQANSVLRQYKGSYSAWPVTLEYETPNYKVWAGDFASRLEAERALIEIKKKFDSAFILPRK